MIMKQQNIKIKQAWFLFLRIKIKDEPWVSLFLKLLFLLPVPLIIPKVIIQILPDKIFKDIPFAKADLKQLIGAKGILVDIKTKDGDHILIKSI